MILYITKFDNRNYHAFPYLSDNIDKFFKNVSYETLHRLSRVPFGTLIFSDLDGLSQAFLQDAIMLRDAFRAFDPEVRILNDPVRALRRYELLRFLFKIGFNSFNVYRLGDSEQSKRFPVFIRQEHHPGDILTPRPAEILTPLLYTATELATAIDDLMRKGHSRSDKIIVEFSDTRSDIGHYHLYSAFNVAGTIIPAFHLFSDHWYIKTLNPKFANPIFLKREKAYLDENPHAAFLSEVFKIAHIEYGRADYAIVDGKPQIFEINTNPTWALPHSQRAFHNALSAINSPRRSILVKTRPKSRIRALREFHRLVFRSIETGVFATGLFRLPGMLGRLYHWEKITRLSAEHLMDRWIRGVIMQPANRKMVLVVDAEPATRTLVVGVLLEYGYDAIEADGGISGLRVLQSPARIDLLVTEVGLHGGINRQQLVDLAHKRPELKVLFMTRVSDRAALDDKKVPAGMAVITKPFNVTALRQEVRALIER